MIYLVAPNATHPSGGVGVAAQWVRLLIEHGYEAMFITPNGDPSPYWLNFTVPAGSYADMEDKPGNKRVDIWMDCAMENKTYRMRHYFFAQDVCQLEHIRKEKGHKAHDEYVEELASGYHLITLTHHAKWYYLYRFDLPSKVVNNWVDTTLFQPGQKDPNAVCMIDHRDHLNPSLAEKLKKAGFAVKIARGTQAEIAKIMGECLFFVSDVRGRWDGYEFSEGMPMPIMEAMAAGCIVLCRDTNGTREFIQDGVNGYFMEDEEMFLEYAHGLSGPTPTRQEVSENARMTMVSAFNQGRTWRQIKNALELE